MLYKIYIPSLKNVHAMQIFPVHIGDCNLPTHQLLLFSYSRYWSRRTGVKQSLELLCFVKYDVPTEFLTLFSWFALLVNQCFDSIEFERCEIWAMFASVPLYEQIINIIKLRCKSYGSNSLAIVTSSFILNIYTLPLKLL